MELTSQRIIKELLLKYGTRPSKGLGQNFLIDKNVLEKIIDAADIKPSDVILEIGPGIGTLTQELTQKAKQVIAVEKSETMCKILGETLKDFENIEIINADILKSQIPMPKAQPNSKFQYSKYKVVANIPYYLTSPLIRKLLEGPEPPSEIILMIQKEVAQRICAKPPTRRRQGYGGRGMNLLAVSVQFYAEPKIISYVSKNCFWPSPKVDSAIIRIHPVKYREAVISQNEKLFNGVNPQSFFRVVKAGFSHPRKQLLNNLSTGLKLSREKTKNWLLQNNIKPNQRAETLSLNDWKNLSNGEICQNSNIIQTFYTKCPTAHSICYNKTNEKKKKNKS